MLADAFQLLRYAVFGVALVATASALAALAIRNRSISPFGRGARAVRSLTDPLLRPFERRLLRAGGNPQSAPWWLVGTAIVGGILVITVLEWLAGQIFRLATAGIAGPRALLVVLVDWTFNLLMLALIVRVVASWVGASPFSRWMRPFVASTEWLLAPLRQIIPPFGMLDVTPLVAWFLLQFVRSLVLNAL